MANSPALYLLGTETDVHHHCLWSYVQYYEANVSLRQGPPRAGLAEADAAQLEERALKMRKAMGENLADDVAGESPDARTRRLNLIKWVPSCCPRWSSTSAPLPGSE